MFPRFFGRKASARPLFQASRRAYGNTGQDRKAPLHTARNETRKWKRVHTPMRKTNMQKTDKAVKTLTTDIKSMMFGIYATVG